MIFFLNSNYPSLGLIVPLKSVVPLTESELNEKTTTKLLKSREFLFWPGSDSTLVFIFDVKSRRILLYDYQSERLVDHIKVGASVESEPALLKALLLDEDLGNRRLAEGSQYYFLLSGYNVLICQASRERCVQKLNLEGLKVNYRRKKYF